MGKIWVCVRLAAADPDCIAIWAGKWLQQNTRVTTVGIDPRSIEIWVGN